MADAHALIAKIRTLPPNRIEEVEDFIDFIAAREQQQSLIRAASMASASAFASVWENPEDDAYDEL